MVRVGILGGSFDPIHLGHSRLAEAAHEKLGLDRVLLVPTARQPLKPDPVAPADDRLAMARLATGGKPWLSVTDIEIARGGVSYTVDTLRALGREFGPEARLFLIAGADVLQDLRHWREIETIVEIATVVVATRPDHALEAPEGLRIERIAIDALPVSSTEARRRLASGEPTEGLIAPAVARYIAKKGLYR